MNNWIKNIFTSEIYSFKIIVYSKTEEGTKRIGNMLLFSTSTKQYIGFKFFLF